MPVPVLNPERWWECPSCHRQHKTVDPRAITPMHSCPNVGGLDVPYVQVHTNAGIPRGRVRHVAIERGDLIGSERGVRHDANGRAVMAIHTERANGSHDTHVFATTATGFGE